MGQYPTFSFIFVHFILSNINYNFNKNWKSLAVVLGIRTRGRGMAGTDETTELRHPNYFEIYVRRAFVRLITDIWLMSFYSLYIFICIWHWIFPRVLPYRHESAFLWVWKHAASNCWSVRIFKTDQFNNLWVLQLLWHGMQSMVHYRSSRFWNSNIEIKRFLQCNMPQA